MAKRPKRRPRRLDRCSIRPPSTRSFRDTKTPAEFDALFAMQQVIVERMLNAELTHHLGYERGEPKPAGQSEDQKQLLGTSDAAEYLGLAVQTLAKMRVSGESPSFYKLGRQVLYDRAELDEWVSVRKRRSTSDAG